MKRKPLFTVVTCGLLLFFFTACNKNNTDIQPETPEEPVSHTEIKTGWYHGEQITYQRKGNENFFEGDILLPDEQLQNHPGQPQTEGAGVFLNARWPGGRVYYTIGPRVPPATRKNINAAIRHYTQYTPIRWIERHNEKNYVTFKAGAALGGDGYAHIGMIGGPQTVSLDGKAALGTVIHEMGHAIGLYHEHTRKDRDRHIRIIWENIAPEQRFNFDIYKKGHDRGPFDFKSNMMYWPTSYSINGKATIVRANGRPFTYVRGGFTRGDVAIINWMY